MTTDEEHRHPTDEPDGTTAYTASLQPPGSSLQSSADAGDDFCDDAYGPPAPRDAFDGTVLPGESRAGYDPADVSGDTDAVRPQ
jgi:hypothetical protein